MPSIDAVPNRISDPSPPLVATIGAALGGPVVLGAVIGLAADDAFGGAAVRGALTMPAVLGGLGLAMAPALYVGIAISGAAPSAQMAARAFMRAARAGGLVLLGFAPAAAFLVATGPTESGAHLLAGAVLAAGGFAAIRILFGDLFRAAVSCPACRETARPHASYCASCRQLLRNPVVDFRASVLFGAWTLVTVLLGARLLVLAFAGADS